MRKNNLKLLASSNKKIKNSWLSIPSSYLAEIVACQGFDSVTVDMQHGLISQSDLVPMLQAISTTHAVPLVRSSGLNGEEIMRLLDSGAYGVICPMISTREDAERLVSFCRYPPEGERSFGPARGLLYGGEDYFNQANQEIMTIAMIESVEGVENIEEIVAVKGLDGIYVGPNDLALSMGCPPRSEDSAEVVEEAIARIRYLANLRGLITGIFCYNGETALRRLEEGFDLVTPSNDANVIKAGMSLAINSLALFKSADKA